VIQKLGEGDSSNREMSLVRRISVSLSGSRSAGRRSVVWQELRNCLV